MFYTKDDIKKVPGDPEILISLVSDRNVDSNIIFNPDL